MALSVLDGVHGFGEGSDLVEFDENGISGAIPDALGENFQVGDKNIISHQLDFLSQLMGHGLPPLPIVFGTPVFDGNDGILIRQPAEKIDHLAGGAAGPV